MSLILDALRKSEAERRRGQAPEVHVELAPEPAPARRWRLPRWWPVPPLAAATGLLAWYALTPSPDAGPHVPAATAVPAVVEAAPAEAASTAVPSDDAARTGPAPAGTPIAGGEGSEAPSAPSRADPAPAEPAPTRSPAVLPDTTAAREPKADPPPAPVRMDTPEPAGPTSRARGAPPSIAQSDPTDGARQPARAPTAVDPAAAPVPSDAPATEPIRLADLSAAERRQLPPLKISMHYWAQAPAQRFAIVDGNRVGEGDRIGNAVVEAITTDAVVIAWRGRRVRVPIR
jgi:general secretion pathway protein B